MDWIRLMKAFLYTVVGFVVLLVLTQFTWIMGICLFVALVWIVYDSVI